MQHEALKRIEQVLGGLTDFQRATVAATCERLMQNRDLHGRILVADEVGLGKTLVARGVIATLLCQRLKQRITRPLRVAYICSNLTLAQENAHKLAVFRDDDARAWSRTLKFGRLAELGLEQPPSPDGLLLELCSLTPATSFSLTRGGGNARERYIIWQALLKTPYIQPTPELKAFFQQNVDQSWTAAAAYCGDPASLEPTTLAEFAHRMGGKPLLDAKAMAAARELGVSLRSWRTLLRDLAALPSTSSAKQQLHLAASVRTHIREMFVEACAKHLKADLFILDEFQRFPDLVSPSTAQTDAQQESESVSEQQIIARRVLHEGTGYGTLLLSATPFKALSHVGDEDHGKAHSSQLEELLMYLSRSDTKLVDRYRLARERVLKQILSLPAGRLKAGSLDGEPKRYVESILRAYVCRTERAAIEPDIERVFRTAAPAHAIPTAAEIAEFVALDKLAVALNEESAGTVHADIMKFYKAAPWCLSFLGGYDLRDNLDRYRGNPKVAAALKAASTAWLPHERFRRFKIDLSRDTPSSRFKQVLNAAAPVGAEKLLWVPPAMPYYDGDGPYAGQQEFSKTLLFSSLVLAPRALSSLVSYECERRLAVAAGEKQRDYFHNDRDASPRAFRFDAKSVSPAWSLVYPSRRLASVSILGRAATLAELKKQVRVEIAGDVKKLSTKYGKGPVQRGAIWYTLAPMLLDRLNVEGLQHIEAWGGAMMAKRGSADARQTQFKRLFDMQARTDLQLGEAPTDLLDYLVDLAIGGPGNCLMRSLCLAWPVITTASSAARPDVLAHATDASLAFIDKMNRLESQRVLRAVCGRAKPWLALANYGAMGNLQAVTDEYIHMLKSAHSTMDESVETFKTALSSGAVSVTAQTRLPPPIRTSSADIRFHCHYAVPLGNQKNTDEKGVKRIVHARAAFNSPFWPFMLNSTSVGQEGLDFHWYCRRIVHWSLPSNPIDLEQREGRVSRYKALVVRQRVAQTHAKHMRHPMHEDVWTELFNRARAGRRRTDLVPYWHFPHGSAQIERIVPAMPFSAELLRLDEMLRILSLYRLSFGQPRQQELLENLLKRDFNSKELSAIRDALLIDLAPVRYLEALPVNAPACQFGT